LNDVVAMEEKYHGLPWIVPDRWESGFIQQTDGVMSDVRNRLKPGQQTRGLLPVPGEQSRSAHRTGTAQIEV
jgi:hypothetical protein